MYLKKDHPWAPGYAYPKNVLSEPDRRGVLVTFGAPRGTIGNYQPIPKPWNPGYALPRNVLAERPGGPVHVTPQLPRGTIAVKQESEFRTPLVDVRGSGIYVPQSPVPRGDLGAVGSLGCDDTRGSLGGQTICKNKAPSGTTLGPTMMGRDQLSGWTDSLWSGIKSVAGVGKKVGCAAGAVWGGGAGRAADILCPGAVPTPVPPPPASSGVSTSTLLLVAGGLAAVVLLTRK